MDAKLPALLVVDDIGLAPVPVSPPELSRAIKAGLLLLFSLAVFVDVLGSSAFFVFTSTISKELDIVFEQQSWIITSYALTFACFLLFWGRVCDLYSAKRVFVGGFFAVGAGNTILSVLTDKYAFFVFRAFTGVAAASLPPASYRLMSSIFPPAERQLAFTVFGMTGSIANVAGTVVAGVIDHLIPDGGQMRSWRWFFRIVAFIAIPGATCAALLVPAEALPPRKKRSWYEATRLLDPIGITLVFSAVLCMILGLTLGATLGWLRPAFFVPFLLSFVLLPTFFWWESRLPEEMALLPPSIWRIPNVAVLIAFGLVTVGWWAVNFIPFIELFHVVNGERMIIAAIRTLPEGVSAGLISIVVIMYPNLVSRPRLPMVGGMLLSAAACALWTQAPSVVGRSYWTHVFPGMLFGSAGMQIVLLGTNVGVMLAAPPGRAGVIGAILQTSLQTSNVIALSIQAGMFTVRPGGIYNFVNVRASWFFELGWVILWLVGFVVLYKPQREGADDEEAQSEAEEKQ